MIAKQGDRYLLEGPVTLHNVGDLIAKGSEFDGHNVIVDLARLTRADSSVLSLLLEWVRHFRASGRQIAFANLGQDLRSLADVYGVTDMIPVAAE